MTTSQGLSRGSHRLGIVLAAIPLVLGIAWTALASVIYSDAISPLAGIAGTFAATLAVYSLVRGIGGSWQLRGFVGAWVVGFHAPMR